ncbi:MAG TPA: hypothetical protein VKZ52_04165 [Burkholderiaceae bacterium]|nr:hypothetical protein [Burkholderiaceae bacterium]
MKRRTTSRDRAVRIELLRARAAIERQSVAHNLRDLGQTLTPRGLLDTFLPRLRLGGGRRRGSDLLTQVFSMSGRYPLLLSMGSALLSTAARRKLRWWKLAAGAVLAWQASRTLRK